MHHNQHNLHIAWIIFSLYLLFITIIMINATPRIVTTATTSSAMRKKFRSKRMMTAFLPTIGGGNCAAAFGRGVGGEGTRAITTSNNYVRTMNDNSHGSAMAAMRISRGGGGSSTFRNGGRGRIMATTAAATLLATSSATTQDQNTTVDSTTTLCENEETLSSLRMPFPEKALTYDTYNGVTIDLSHVSFPENNGGDEVTMFQQSLQNALHIWNAEERKGIWIRVPTSKAHLIPASTHLGFDFQHAKKGELILTKWLPTDCESRLPHGPTHQVGVGTLVLHPTESGKMLVVQEKSGPAAAKKLWKMPTGLTDPGEDIPDAAVRELKEETGLNGTFEKILCIRQAHMGSSKSDMFFVCLVRLHESYLHDVLNNGKEIELRPQEEEILMASWMDVEDYAMQKVWQGSPLYKEMNDVLIDTAREAIEKQRGGNDNGYHGKQNDENNNDDLSSKNLPEQSQTQSLAPEGVATKGGLVGKKLPVGFRPGSNTIYVCSSRL
mmetsp:Transcript_52/g.83  ORF Transcript_52/g.83 Transcript_52/m.83 type:complete len:495 (-) Transcript_52:352-1836(-)